MNVSKKAVQAARLRIATDAKRGKETPAWVIKLAAEGHMIAPASCRKVAYKDRLSAQIALARTQHRDNPRRPKTERRTYLCPDCHKWHLTSKGSR